MKVLLTGGGSGGHVSPALAVARYLQRTRPDTELLYVGGKLTMEGSTGPSIEEKLVVPTGIPFKSIHSGKLKRDAKFSISIITRLWGVVPGMAEAMSVVRNFKPDVIFSSGGYVSLPVVIAGWLLHIPVVIHEQTAVVGLANSIAGKFATYIAVTFAQSTSYFPANKVVVTGNPLRHEVSNPPRLPESSEFGRWIQSVDRPIIYVTGGGLGSHIINVAIEQGLEMLLSSYAVIHQSGAHAKFKDFERLSAISKKLDETLRRRYWLATHFSADEVGQIYQRASMMVARAGANTVLEAAAVGMPTIFIPIPWVTHDEQTKNAQVLVEAGTAVIIPESALTFERLDQEIHRLSQPGAVTKEAKVRAQRVVISDATEQLADLIVKAGTKNT